MRRSVIAVVIAAFPVLLILGLAQSGNASHAINSTLHYSFKNDCTSGNRVDPVTVVFTNLATTDRVNQNVNAHTDLDHGATPFGAQLFGVNNTCSGQTVDKSSCAQWTCDRWHMRGRQSPVTHAIYGSTTATTPHGEDWIWADPFFWELPNCDVAGFGGNHAVDGNSPNGSGFDQAREHILSGFVAGGHVYETLFWGNTDPFVQCDGETASSNGTVYYIKISHGH